MPQHSTAYLKSNQPDKAIADFDVVLRLNPTVVDSRYGRGLALIKKNDVDRGNADLASAKAIDSDISQQFDRYGIH